MLKRITRAVARFALLMIPGALCAPALAAPEAGDAPILRLEPGGHTSEINGLIFAEDGRLISVGRDKVVRVWDVETGAQVKTLRFPIGPGPVGGISAAALHGDTLAIGGYDSKFQAGGRRGEWVAPSRRQAFIRIFDLKTDSVRVLDTGHKEPVSALDFSSDGSLLASASADRTVRVWDVRQNYRMVRSLEHGHWVTAVAFQPGAADLLATASYDGNVRVWNVKTGGKPLVMPAGAPVQCVCWDSQGKALASGDLNKNILFWDPLTGKSTGRHAQKDSVTCLAYSADGRMLMTGSGASPDLDDRTVRIWSLPDMKARELREHTGTIYAVAFSRKGLVASADLAGVICVWDSGTGKVVRRLKGSGGTVRDVAWSPDGKSVAWGSRDDQRLEHTFNLADALPGPDVTDAKGDGFVRGRMTAGGKTLKISRVDQRGRLIQVVEIQQGGAPAGRIELDQGDDPALCAAFVTDTLVAVGGKYQLALFDISGRQPKQVRQLLGHSGDVYSVAVSPNGKYLASGSSDQTIRIWNLEQRPRRIGEFENAVLPLLSVFSGARDEWVVWNDEYGYYAASPTGDQIVGWQINKEEGKEPLFYSVHQFRERLNRPYVISQLLESGDVETALKQISAKAKADEERVRKELEEQKRRAEELARQEEERKKEAERQEAERIRKEAELKRLEELARTEQQKKEAERLRKQEEARLERERLEQKRKEEEIRRQQEQQELERKRLEEERRKAELAEQKKAQELLTMAPELEFLEAGGPGVQMMGSKLQWRTNQPRITLSVRVTGPDQANVDLNVSVNYPVASKALEEHVRGNRPGEILRDEQLVQGLNVIRIVARNKISGLESNPIRLLVEYVPPPEVRKDQNLYLLAIGISEYQDSSIPSLNFSDADAKEMAEVYKNSAGRLFTRVIPRVLVNKQATAAGIRDALNGLSQATPEDTVLVYVSSHGFERDGNFYLAPADGKVSDIKGTCIAWTSIIDRLRQLKVRNVLLMLDHCNSGGVGDLVQEAARQKAAGTAFAEAKNANIVTFASSTAKQKSYEYPAERHSVFTFVVLDALKGRVSTVLLDDGVIPLNRLDEYTQMRVQQIVTTELRQGEGQTPVLYVDPTLRHTLRVGKVAATTARIPGGDAR